MDSALTATKVETIFTWAQNSGKSTGIVTTDTVTAATPAALYAHSADRDWEGDSELPEGAAEKRPIIFTYFLEKKSFQNYIFLGIKDIALQLVTENPGQNANVVFGGGHKFFFPEDRASISR